MEHQGLEALAGVTVQCTHKLVTGQTPHVEAPRSKVPLVQTASGVFTFGPLRPCPPLKNVLITFITL